MAMESLLSWRSRQKLGMDSRYQAFVGQPNFAPKYYQNIEK
jgi:hypothetical protein